MLIVTYAVGTATGFTAAGVAIAMQFGHTTAGGIGAAITVLGFVGLGLTASVLGSMGISRLTKTDQTNKAFEEEAKVINQYAGYELGRRYYTFCIKTHGRILPENEY